MKECSFTVHGKVQGVWFRAWTRDMARELGVTGWVRNKSDGNVEGAVQGNDDLIATFIERLHDGPPLARVSQVDTNRTDDAEQLTSFEVRT